MDPKDLKNDESNEEEEVALVLNEKDRKEEEEAPFLEEKVNFKEKTNNFFKIMFLSILSLVIMFVSLSCVDFISRADKINVN